MSATDIAVAVDGSAASHNAVRWAANTADKRGVNLRLVSSYVVPQYLYAEGMVPPDELFEELRTETSEKLEAAERIVRESHGSVKVGHTVVEGPPIDMLLELSEEVEMIVMGSRGLGGLSGMVMGSVSAAVVSHASCPVVVVRDDTDLTDETKYGPVVVGVDGSEVSNQAIEYAFTEAEHRGAKLIGVHTVLDNQGPRSGASGNRWDQIAEKEKASLQDLLKPFAQRHPDVNYDSVLSTERPVHALVEEAKKAQLLVVGSRGRGGFKGMLLGSTSRALLQSAPCPLMVVRNQG